MTNPSPADLARALAELRTRHVELTDTVEHVVTALEALRPAVDRAEPGAWSWEHLDADRAATLWHQLDQFVHDLNTREELTHPHHIPPCWHHHPRAVEDLTALLAAWQDAYHRPAEPTTALIAYRHHYLWPTLIRLTETNTPLRRCIDKDQHSPWQAPDDAGYLDPDGQPYDPAAQLAHHLARDTARRP
ncbi:DUF4913 domain-containing protein [Actinosynnema sp. NPDC023587]|uniref:DUF4913 domain-containing protein n=1 Tax=Actinosynnema sp. NPDC023587 TaxID=3154695 RepID=UPI0033EF05FC